MLRLVMLCCVAVSLAAPATAAAEGGEHSVAVRSVGLLWGGKRFSSRAAFNAWLRPRSLSYARWARKHPAGRRILAHPLEAPAAVPALTTVEATTADALAHPSPSEAGPAAERSTGTPQLIASAPTRHRHRSPLLLLLFALSLAALALVLSPLERLAPSSRLAAVLIERRAGVAAAAIAILVGIGVATLVS